MALEQLLGASGVQLTGDTHAKHPANTADLAADRLARIENFAGGGREWPVMRMKS